MNTNYYCRLCLNSEIDKSSCISVLIENGLNQKTTEIILNHFPIIISEDDGFSKVICGECWNSTDVFHKFYQKIMYAQNRLLLKTENPHEKVVKDIDCLVKEYEIINEYKIEESFNIESEWQNRDDNEEEDFEEKKKSVEIAVKIDNTVQSNNLFTRRSSRKKNCVEKPATNKVKPSKNKLIRKKIKKDKDMEHQIDDKKELKRVSNNEFDGQVRMFFRMSCEICDIKFDTFVCAKRHYRVAHSRTGYLSCCTKRYFRRADLVDHIIKHLNPEAFKCKICNKTFKDRVGLKHHIENHNSIEDRPFKCKLCKSSFNKRYILDQHVRVTHVSEDDKKFKCDDCGKMFISKCLLRTHIRHIHEGANSHICDVCAKVFKSKSTFENHRAEHLGIKRPKEQCTTCGLWFKNYFRLRAHTVRMHEKQEKKVCSICNKEVANKIALGAHMRFVHTTSVYQCTMCDKAFKKPLFLKEHMATHTGEDLYECLYCTKTFKSSANMHSHKKKAHPIEWQQNRYKKLLEQA